jgi:hypothetical protein
MLASRRAGNVPSALRRIYILTPAPPGALAEILPATAQEVIPALLEAAFRIDTRDADLLSRQFRFLMKVAAETPIRRLRYAHDFAALPALCERIVQEAEV